MIEQEEEKVEDSRLLPKVNFFFMLNYPDQIKLALPPTQVRSQDERPPDLLSPEAYAHNNLSILPAQISFVLFSFEVKTPYNDSYKERPDQSYKQDECDQDAADQQREKQPKLARRYFRLSSLTILLISTDYRTYGYCDGDDERQDHCDRHNYHYWNAAYHIIYLPLPGPLFPLTPDGISKA